MRRSLIVSALAVAVAAGLAAVTLERIPPDSVGWIGGAQPRTLSPGIHFRLPFTSRPAIYPLAFTKVTGAAEVATADGVTLKVPYEVSARLDPTRIADFRKAQGARDPQALLRRSGALALGQSAAARPSSDLASGALDAVAAQRAGAILAPAGVSEVVMKTGPLDPASLRLGPDGVLRCAVPRGPARFTRAGQVGLAHWLREDPGGAEGFSLIVNGRSWPIHAE